MVPYPTPQGCMQTPSARICGNAGHQSGGPFLPPPPHGHRPHRLAVPRPPSMKWVCMPVAPTRRYMMSCASPSRNSGSNEHGNDDGCPITAVLPAAVGGVARLVVLGAARLPPESPPPSPHQPQTRQRFPRRNARADSQSRSSIARPSLRWAGGFARPCRACRGFARKFPMVGRLP